MKRKASAKGAAGSRSSCWLKHLLLLAEFQAVLIRIYFRILVANQVVNLIAVCIAMEVDGRIETEGRSWLARASLERCTGSFAMIEEPLLSEPRDEVS